MPSNTQLFTSRARIFGRRGPVFGKRGDLFTPCYTARPLLTQAGFQLTTQDGRMLTIQGQSTS